MTVGTALQQGTRALETGGVGAARLTAEMLLAHAAHQAREWLYAHPERELTDIERLHYGRYLHERLGGKPAQYITGRQEFYGREFRVTPDVLIPRPETEHVLELAMECARGAGRIVDIGTGSGALAVTLALETGARVCATDVSSAAVAVARDNAARLGAAVDLVVCDLVSALGAGAADVVVSNPPYVPRGARAGLQREVRDWEPEVALYAGDTGFEIYDRIVADAPRVLGDDGWLVLELGFGSLDHVTELLAGWRDLRVIPDLAGIPRAVAARR
jgi:release factor glutamine methyltransferase